MPTDHRTALANIKRFDQLIAYLRDAMGWPIARDSFEDVDDLFYDFTADELGIDPKTAATIEEIKRLRPLSTAQPWGIFFIKFEPKRLPVVALRRILSQVAQKKRASANSAERTAWAADDLLFVSNYGEGSERQISFAHFSKAPDGHDLPTLKVLGWDNLDTALHLDAVAKELTQDLTWPEDEQDTDAWRERWRSAFTLRHREVIDTSKELSIRLAKLAGDIRDRIKTALAIETDRGPLTKLMKAFREALVHDLDAAGFADMYAQTIAYGLLSARIADPHGKTADDITTHMRTNPFLKELMQTFLHIGGRRGKAGGPGIDFDELGVADVVELLNLANMEAVVLDFGDKNPQEDPVIHFYELFLKEYDARKRMQRGVFYTPRPVVSYIVRSVDELLRTEFGLEDGLADTTTWGEMAKRHKDLKVPEGTSPDHAFVQILDPATGTGTFLVEVIDIIHKTMVAKWKAQGHGEKRIDTLWNEYVPKHLLTRLHGYELLMAPYAIAHLKVGLKLYETGYRFDSDVRARIYLTNALEPAQDFSGTFEFAIPALAHEAQAVNEIKRKQRFTVVIGNPPYSLYTANLTAAANRLISPFRVIAGDAVRERGALQLEKNLQDDYVKFFGLGQQMVSSAGVGLLGFISNHGYLNNRTLRGMRWSQLECFDQVRIVDLHGSASRASTESRGASDQNVFDIQQGVAIGVFARRLEKMQSVSYADILGPRSSKYAWLGAHGISDVDWRGVSPREPLFSFEPRDADTESEYRNGVSLDEVFPLNSTGIVSARDALVVQFTSSDIESVTEMLKTLSPERARAEFDLGADTKDWAVARAQADVRSALRNAIQPTQILYRPFDLRWTLYTGQARGFMCNPRRPVMAHLLGGSNIALCANRQVNSEYRHASVTRGLVTDCTLSTATKERTYVFPLYLHEDSDSLLQGESHRPNIASSFVEKIARTFDLRRVAPHAYPSGITPEAVFQYLFALLHSPEYRSRYSDFLRADFPRLPLTGNLELFCALARLGGELTALHLLESPKLDHFITTYTGPNSPEVGRVGWSDDTVWLDAVATKKGQPATPGAIGFRGVPEAVWNFHIGGYQVCEKWLKDRKGRTLSKDDIVHYQKIVVALNETIRLMQEIDVVIEKHGGWPGAFQTDEAQAAAARVVPFQPRIVQPGPKERYVTCVPLVPLKVAAGAFSDPQHIDDEGFEWTAVETRRHLRPGMFVAQVVGKSMEPAIPDGAYCLFAAPVEGTRQGKTVLVQLRDATDPESGERYTVKRYESVKTHDDDLWRHTTITLKPINPDFEPIFLTTADDGELKVVAELVEVLAAGSEMGPG